MKYVLVLAALIAAVASFEVPEATVEVLEPQGFKVSIPALEGIKLFAFHGNLNADLNGREGGQFSADVNTAVDGRWTYINKNTKLKPGDVLNYWTYVDYYDGVNKLGYALDDQEYVVRRTY